MWGASLGSRADEILVNGADGDLTSVDSGDESDKPAVNGAASPTFSERSLLSSTETAIASEREELVVMVAEGMTSTLTYDGVDVCASRVAWEVSLWKFQHRRTGAEAHWCTERRAADRRPCAAGSVHVFSPSQVRSFAPDRRPRTSPMPHTHTGTHPPTCSCTHVVPFWRDQLPAAQCTPSVPSSTITSQLSGNFKLIHRLTKPSRSLRQRAVVLPTSVS